MNTKELLNLDWISVNYLVEASPLKEGLEYHSGLLKFIPENHGTRQFRHIYQIHMDYVREPIATLVCNPLSKILDSRLHQIKIANWCLYQENTKNYLRVIKEALNAKFLSLSRIDICVDICGFDFYGFIKKYHNNEIREKKPKDVTEHYKKYNTESIYTGISWGSKLSDWTAKIYDKIREINEISGKEYILDYFQENGIDIDKEKIWRYEFSITSLRDKYVTDNNEITINDENIFDFNVQKIVLRYYLKLHAFAENTGKVRFIDERRYHILNLLSQEIPPKRVRSNRQKKKDYSAKVSINLGMQCLEYQSTCDAFITYKSILEIAREYRLTEWLVKRHGKRLQEIYTEKSFCVYGIGVEYKRIGDLFEQKIYLKK